MDSKYLKAPKPVKANPFIYKWNSGQLTKYNRMLYRESERVKSENFLCNPSTYNGVLNDLDDLEKDFIEIDAKSEILSILNNEASFSSSYNYRDSEISVSTFDFNEQYNENPFKLSKNQFFKSI
jgi:hypothetical protein